MFPVNLNRRKKSHVIYIMYIPNIPQNDSPPVKCGDKCKDHNLQFKKKNKIKRASSY